MAYKAQFRPHELLVNGHWQAPPEGGQPDAPSAIKPPTD
jgi:arginyl-tRNA--protein-N-Asp/Glu arginylyltransferase